MENTFTSVTEAVLALKLDRRVKWFELNGSLARNVKFNVRCHECSGNGCSECRGRGNVSGCYPEFVIHKKSVVKIQF